MEHTTMLGGNLWIWVIFIGFTIISWLISNQLKNRFQKYSKIPTANGMTGRDVVEKMLRDNGISGVKIGTVEGQLTDHYNPANKTINLSKETALRPLPWQPTKQDMPSSMPKHTAC